MANITSIGGNPIVPAAVQNNSVTDAMLKQTGGVLSRVASLSNDLDSITIEGYGHDLVEVPGTVVSGHYYSRTGVVHEFAQYSYKEVACEPGTTYTLGGSWGTDAALYVVLNSQRGVVEAAESRTGGYEILTYTAPAGAAYIVVNSAVSAGSPSVKATNSLAFIRDVDPSEELTVIHGAGDVYSIAGSGFSYTVNLSGSDNGLFNFTGMSDASGTFKSCGDDITPVYIDVVGYVGANHGYNFVYNCVATSHGLTASDIGKTSTDGTNTWVLIQVKDSNTIVVGQYDASTWFRLNATAAPTTLDFGTSITVESATRTQLHPSVKNGEVKFVDSDRTKCLVMETYDIIEVGTGIDALMENVGSNTNDSVATLAESAITVRNLYEFHANGSVTIYQNMKVLKDYIPLRFYSGVQSMPFGTSDSYMVPQTSKRGIWPSEQIQFTRDMWSDQNVPPVMYIQVNGNASNFTKGMLTGYIGPNRNGDISSHAGSVSSSRKMYPYAINPASTVDAGKTYSFVSFRVPAHLFEYSNKVALVSYTRAYDDIYLFVYAGVAVNTSIALPEFMWGKRCEVYMSDGMTCENTSIIDSVDVRSSASYGSIILKLSD